MKKEIKAIYLGLGILVLVLVTIILMISISKQINWDFFSFDKEACISNHLYSLFKSRYIRIQSDEEIEAISQIWDLNKEEVLAIREEEKSLHEKFKREEEECKERGESSMFSNLFSNCFGTERPSATIGDLIKNRKAVIPGPLLEKLTSKYPSFKKCQRPSFLK